jgi:hypothetical protein
MRGGIDGCRSLRVRRDEPSAARARSPRQGADLPQMALVVHSCAHAKLAHTQNCHNEKRKNEGGHRWMPVPARAARRAVGGPCSEPAVPAASAPRNLAWVPSEPWPGFHTAAISPPFGLRWPESWPSSFKFRVLQVKSQEITPKVESRKLMFDETSFQNSGVSFDFPVWTKIAYEIREKSQVASRENIQSSGVSFKFRVCSKIAYEIRGSRKSQVEKIFRIQE